MIPWQLKFSGVRDYGATRMNFDTKEDHVMISGPNGSGKSTITFCIGAVLYSSKVELEGLKSRNLLPGETWNSTISIIFKNEGESKIDAPPFISFTVRIVQEPNQPIKREYSVATGETVDGLEHKTTYRSGDQYNSFSKYKKDLQFKYKIDPDVFYLIWYQQEVNQFAVMSPEERFRVFSEMNGIDKAQKDWETSMEQVKEAKEILRLADSNLRQEKMEMHMMKTALDRYMNNRQRLKEHGTVYISSLLRLEQLYIQKNGEQESLLEQLLNDIEEQKDHQAEQLAEKEQIEKKIERLQQDEAELATRIDNERLEAASDKEIIDKLTGRIDEFEKELEHVEGQKSRLTMTEQETNESLVKTEEQIVETTTRFEHENRLDDELFKAWGKLVEQIAELKQEINYEKKEHMKNEELLNRYKNSHHMLQMIKMLEIAQRGDANQLNDLDQNKSQLQAELQMIDRNEYISDRQKESLTLCRQNGIPAFSLRELIQLDEAADVKDEQKFNALKYTVFYDGKSIEPPNDLYHVSLKKVVPDRSVTAIPELNIKIRSGLSEGKTVYAMKALWWLEQFFTGNQIDRRSGVLKDQKGFRGNQEKAGWILSEQALRLRREKIKDNLRTLFETERNLIAKKDQELEKLRQLNSDFQKVQEAEAFMTRRNERRMRAEKLREYEGERKRNEEEREKLKVGLHDLRIRQVELDFFAEELKRMLEVYGQLGELAPKYEELKKMKIERDAKKKRDRERNRHLDELDDALVQLGQYIRTGQREVLRISDSLDRITTDLMRIVKQQENASMEIDHLKNERLSIAATLTNLQPLVPAIYDEAQSSIPVSITAITELKIAIEQAKVQFDYARTEDGIDPAAPQNYEAASKKYELKKGEYDQANILLEQNIERMENLEHHLETTINMKVRTLQQQFQSYMGQFQFEGDIEWKRFEDSRKRIVFKLFIKARKEGHRGKMEDVSVKARGGKVGKGVSGGEESLSSLLFALALLQSLQSTSGFIILDEFDSALDEQRKVKVFELYASELRRKLIILSPKSHDNAYYDKFKKAFIVSHNPSIPLSRIVGIKRTEDSKLGINMPQHT